MTFSCKLSGVLLLSSSLFIHASLAVIVCDDLPKDVCAFSIASSGKRCLLEKVNEEDGKSEYECKTSDVEFEKMAGHVEKEQCIVACGVVRKSFGISSDPLLHDPQFLSKLCSPDCHKNCPNIVDFYFNLAQGEGDFLPELCEKNNSGSGEGNHEGHNHTHQHADQENAQQTEYHHLREMIGRHSSIGAAPSPKS